ncbi:DUF4136 domain-containing protein [Brevundimonas sp. Root1279]|uniref:DUF4136 domain-containing protein n=1 Tax=Brevundimonas sp. Root1279 TaxID=1736443 RepID=UPI0006F6EE73|nr:DUF4136 domain-containing protein [Brevundimonas sp. Root1279]KQW78781.1 hypothetical protein ASC65_15825 [Brevundimonas sp. Root1279]
MKGPALVVFAVGMLLGLAACETTGPNLTVTQNSAIAPGSTYAWKPIESVRERGVNPAVANDLVQQRIQTAIEAGLDAKGFRQVSDPGQATLLVAYFIGLTPHSDVRAAYTGPVGPAACGFSGCVPGWGVYGYPALEGMTVNYTDGTVILDLTDQSSNQLAWRAVSKQRVDSTSIAQSTLNAIFAEMMTSLPGAR